MKVLREVRGGIVVVVIVGVDENGSKYYSRE